VFPIYRRAADKVTPVDWPPGVLTSQIRSGSPAGPLVATLTVDDADRLASDGGSVVLRLTDEQTEVFEILGTVFCDVKRNDGGVEADAVPTFYITIKDAVTE